ncbi:MAG: GNAT family N-acetyltransferase [Nitrosomonadales bacterium]|nr:GNAT family N-acetyltransferase [Nitrosomonadales bacterium]
MDRITVHMVGWHDGEPLLRALRETVFMREQNVPAELEWDGLDEHCRHALALDAGGNAIGCGRITPDGHIGRMAVLREWRGKRVGSALLEALLEYAHSQGYAQVVLNAQVQALPFYRRFGFEEEGDEFMDAGMAHRRMRLRFQL